MHDPGIWRSFFFCERESLSCGDQHVSYLIDVDIDITSQQRRSGGGGASKRPFPCQRVGGWGLSGHNDNDNGNGSFFLDITD